MRHIKFTKVLFSLLVMIFLIHGCQKEVPNGIVAFTTTDQSITTDDLSPVTFSLSIDPAAPVASTITIDVTVAGGEAGTVFTADPPVRSGEIVIPVEAGDLEASFLITPLAEGLAYDDIAIAFEIFSVGEGLETEGLVGRTSALYIENLKEIPTSSLPILEYFETCDGADGSGLLPEGWEEKVLTQNSQGTAHWVCAPGFDGVECNAFSADGEEGDGSEVWLLSPKIDLNEASSPVLSFATDRRFESADFQEYDVKISSDYDGSNFAAATWTVLTPAVSAIEANDPETDDYEVISDLDLSTYIGENITIAFIYYAEGSKFTATILRFDDFEINEAK